MNAEMIPCPYGTLIEIATTADTSLKIEATSFPNLLAAAGWGFTWLITDPETLTDSVQQEIGIQSDNPEMLLMDWLNELLYRFEVRHELFRCFSVAVHGDSMHARVAGEVIAPSLMQFRNAVKAVTWHGLSIEKTNGLHSVTILFDL